MRDLFIDLETYSDVDLTVCGVHKYVESPDFEIQLLTYAFDDEPPVTLDLTAGDYISKELIDALCSPEVRKNCWNASFEHTCLSRHLRYLVTELPWEQWYDDMVLSAVCGLPMNLGAAGAALGLPEDAAKDKAGKALVRWFGQPCKPTKTHPERNRHLPTDYPEKWESYKSYNNQDVVAERTIHRLLERWLPGETEHDAWVMDQGINDRGVHIDMTLAAAAVGMDERYKAELTARAVALTGMENPSSVAQIKQWLLEQEGKEVPSLNKKVVAEVVASLETDRAKQFMKLRAELAKSSTAKYKAMLRSACADGHARGCFMFYGAGRTGRWCLTGDHEVLTPQGWTRLDQWKGGEIICWNKDSGQLSFQASDPVSFDYEGDMVAVDQQRCAQISTPDHKMPTRRTDGRWVDRLMGDLVGHSFIIPFTGIRSTPGNVNNNALRVLVMVQADGTYTPGNSIKLHFSRGRKIQRCKQLLRRAEIPYTCTVNSDKTTTFAIRYRDQPIWLRMFRDKTFGWWLLQEDASVIIDELEQWDGTRCGPNSIQYVTTNRQNAEVIQAVAALSGLSATLLTKERTNPKWNTAYILNIWLAPKEYTHINTRQTQIVTYSGKVYCAQTGTGYFMVRRDGRVWITGNSGKRIQFQNISKNKMPDIDPCRALVRDGDYDTVKLLYGGVTSVLSELVRTALIPEPGHRFIVCDYSAIEARVLAWIAGEEWALEEFRGDGQIYEATGAMMFHVPKETIAKGGVNHDRRQAAKTAVLACVAEGQLVLTDHGVKPIEDVSIADRVWDGVEWVHHEGVVCNGYRDTMFVNGVELTPDHAILTEGGMITCGCSQGLNWANIRLPDRIEASGEHCIPVWAQENYMAVPLHLRERSAGRARASAPQEEADEILRVYVPANGRRGAQDAWDGRHTAVQRVERNAAAVLQSIRQKLRAVRGAWHQGLRQVGKELLRLFGGHGADLSTGTATGQNRQHRGLHARELPLGHALTEWAEQAQHHHRRYPVGQDSPGRAGGDHRENVLHVADQVLPGKAVALTRGRTNVRVYDLLNAGHRHRFCLVARDGALRCVSNCGYGGGRNALLAFGADKMGMSDEDMVRTVDLWREANSQSVKLWRALEKAAIRCVVRGTPTVSTVGRIRFDLESGILWMTLPSGRRIAYYGARYGDSRWGGGKKALSYMGTDQKSHKWARLETWGGKLTENCWRGDTPVLTARGWVPIRDVRWDDLLWDGVEWVHHGGSKCVGRKEVIELDGLGVTPDHKIWTVMGWVRAEDCDGVHPRAPGDPAPRAALTVGGALPPEPVYDLINAGPRHRYVVLGDSGPIVAHNCVQATARDCLRDAMLALTSAGFDIRAHVHDEVIITEPRDGRTLEDVAAIMGRELPWAPGLPLRGDGYYCDYYVKD